MSSKRKNTPTKLAADEMLITTVEEACMLVNGRTDCRMSELRCDDSDSSGSELNLHIVSGDADDDDSEDEPPMKKQHLLDGTDYSDSDTVTAEDLSAASPPHRHSFVNHINNNNNSILTKPYSGSNQRKSMNHVLRRLNSKQDSSERQDEEARAEGDVIGSIKAVISSTDATVQQKQQQISDMIKELQRIRESLEHNDAKVRIVCVPQTLRDSNQEYGVTPSLCKVLRKHSSRFVILIVSACILLFCVCKSKGVIPN